MTLAELDLLRGLANEALERYREHRGRAVFGVWFPSGQLYASEAELTRARDRVEAALRVWWEQGCKEDA
jgi:hypothetical protein